MGLLFAAFLSRALSAQITTTSEAGGTTAAATTNDAGPAGIVPFVKGFNASLGTSSQHDSTDGWSSLLTPDIAYRFNRHFSVDAGAPVFAYINVLSTVTKAAPVQTLETRHALAGDTALNGHYETSFDVLDYNVTASIGFPSGDSDHGLGAGQVTYNFNNHFEKTIHLVSPDIEVGFGDTSSLIADRVRKSYTTVGKLAHFQAGFTLELPRNLSFEANAYEELPVASQTVFTTTRIRRRNVTTSHTEGAAEDNGFLSSLDIPLNPRVVLSGFYNRSLRAHIDTAGFSFTFFLKGAPTEAAR